MKNKKKTIRKSLKPLKVSKEKNRGEVCERFREEEMCYRCLDLSRALLLCGELDMIELKKIRTIMTNIISKKGVLKDEVTFLNELSDTYLN